MKTRLFHQTTDKKLDGLYSSEASIKPGYFGCLKGQDVITAKVSDHHPIIHDGVLFWNVMMQGRRRSGHAGASYNNGFGIIESDETYIRRLIKVANVIAEIMSTHPSLEVINLCEGPIQPLHRDTLLHSLKKHHSMRKFFREGADEGIFHKPNVEGFQDWGLLMLADKKYKVNKVKCDFIDRSIIFNKLANRFQIWELTNDKGPRKYIGLGHFPFGGDERITEKNNLSVYGNRYCHLLRKLMRDYADEQFILCADFNFNPYLISEWKDRAMDKIANNNSILLTAEEKSNKVIIDTVTVDGILLSGLEKQRYSSARFNFNLFSRLLNEDVLVQASIKEFNEQFGYESKSWLVKGKRIAT